MKWLTFKFGPNICLKKQNFTFDLWGCEKTKKSETWEFKFDKRVEYGSDNDHGVLKHILALKSNIRDVHQIEVNKSKKQNP
jgi:hypothetical protein